MTHNPDPSNYPHSKAIFDNLDSPEHKRAVEVWKELKQNFCDDTDMENTVTAFVDYVLHQAHGMMRDGVITPYQFAVIMDEAVCY